MHNSMFVHGHKHMVGQGHVCCERCEPKCSGGAGHTVAHPACIVNGADPAHLFDVLQLLRNDLHHAACGQLALYIGDGQHLRQK